MKEVKLSVVVCTYNRSKLLKFCLKSLAEQSLSKEFYEIIVINNNSTDNTCQIVEEFIQNYPNFNIFLEEKQGTSYARNRGWQEAKGDYIAYIDDDAKASPEWCEKIINVFECILPKPVAVGGEICPWYEDPKSTWLSEDLDLITWGKEIGFLKPPRAKFGFCASNMAFPKNILENYGGFSTTFLGMVGDKLGPLGEETEFFTRLSEKGNKNYYWYDPNIRVYHWTPIHKMNINYRFLRAFISGKSQAIIDRLNLFSYSYLKKILGFFFFIFIKIPFYLIVKKGAFTTKMFKIIQEFGSRIGYLFAVFTY